MYQNLDFGTGRINEVISALEANYGINHISELSTKTKLDCACMLLCCSYDEFDQLIACNSPVLRTVKGHAFEIFFDLLMKINGYVSKEVGGDNAIDRVVNNYSLQLKTPTLAGTKDTEVQFKTHKTHGAKSESESMDYYHSFISFADYLVGLISYQPLRVLLLCKDEIPNHSKDRSKIKSPFEVDWKNHLGLNAFERIGISSNIALPVPQKSENYLKLTSHKIGIDTEVIISTIFNRSNFRIWDMSIRGFAREQHFLKFLDNKNIRYKNVNKSVKARKEKADGIFLIDGIWAPYQMKGISTNNCKFDIEDPIIGTETQLTRGRVNDHPTQSRLYQIDDFDYLVLGIDPAQTVRLGLALQYKWTFFSIPSIKLKRHKKYQRRYNSLQKFKLSDLKQFVM